MKRKSFKNWLNDEYSKSVEQLESAGSAEMAKANAEYMDYVAEWLDAANKSEDKDVKAIGEAVTDLQQATQKANLEMQKAIKQQGLALQKLMDRQASGSASKEVDAKIDAIKNKIESIHQKGDGIQSVGVVSKAELNAFAQKATVTTASITNNTDAFRVQEIGQLAFRALTLYDLFPKVPVGENSNGVVRYTDWDDATKVRAAAMIAEEGTFPESTAAWQEYSETLRKVGDTIKISYESTRDRARFVAELNQFLGTNVDLVIDQQLYDGDGTGQNLNGVYTRADTYTPVASGITDANIFDLIRKVRTDITKGKRSKYMANVCMMNADDIDDMLLKKDADNNYVRPDFFQLGDGTNVYIVSGVLIIETNTVTANTMLVGDSRYARIYEEGGYEILMGYNSDDFSKDLMTLKARKRLLMLVREVDKDAWRKVTSISAALTTLAT